jgi:hypothetical protein
MARFGAPPLGLKFLGHCFKAVTLPYILLIRRMHPTNATTVSRIKRES